MPKTESGNMYILVVGDYLTKWKEAFAIPYHEAKTMALIMKLANEAISRYGASEKNPDFEAQLFQEMCVLFNMDKNRISPYHPKSDGMVEEWTVPCKTCLLSICLIICATGLSVCRWRWWPVVPVYMHQRITLRFIFCLAMRYEYQLMLCLDDNQITSQKWQTMWGSCVKKSMSIPESSFELPRNARRTITNSEWLERKSRLAIEYSFMIQLGRKGRLRSFAHHGWSSCDQN